MGFIFNVDFTQVCTFYKNAQLHLQRLAKILASLDASSDLLSMKQTRTVQSLYNAVFGVHMDHILSGIMGQF